MLVTSHSNILPIEQKNVTYQHFIKNIEDHKNNNECFQHPENENEKKKEKKI
jgi:hypothetical protein